MANNKVQLADGTTLIDLTSDTVTPQTMLAGTTAHAASGEQITGVVNLANAGTAIPLENSGDGNVGSSTSYAREDHVHPMKSIYVAVQTGETVTSFAKNIMDAIMSNTQRALPNTSCAPFIANASGPLAGYYGGLVWSSPSSLRFLLHYGQRFYSGLYLKSDKSISTLRALNTLCWDDSLDTLLASKADNLDLITKVNSSDIGIVIDGLQSALGASVGQFVVLVNSEIAGATDGLYRAVKAIPANTDIDSTYISAVSNGGLNAVINPPDIVNCTKQTIPSGRSTTIASIGAWYCLSCINNATADKCAAYLIKPDYSMYYAGVAQPGSVSNSRCVTPWLYFPEGVTFLARPFYTDSDASGLLIAKPL